MKAVESNLLKFLQASPQFVIPIYQRTYSWTIKECQQLWDDVMRAGKDDRINAHFIGSVVYIQEDLYQASRQSPLLVIDGQQRLTTVSLILEALARHVEGEPIDGFSALKIRHYFLQNPLESGDRGHKLLLTQNDRTSLLALVRQQPLPDQSSIRVRENFEFFDQMVEKLGSGLYALCRGLLKLMIVDVSLSRGQDNPQLIFESMNSTGRELSQADLIRNYVLMGLDPEHQTRLYEAHWRPMEVRFGQESYGTHFDRFMRDYLTIKSSEIPNVRAVYEAFKEYAARKPVAEAGVDALVEDIERFANYYCAMALGREPDRRLAEAFQDLRELRVDVAYPFLLEVYARYDEERLSRDDFLSIVRLVEAYVFRRSVCAIPTNSLNKTFATFTRGLDDDSYFESVQAAFQLLPSYRRFPNDDEFRREFESRDIYNFRSRSYWLRRFENDGRKERVPVDEYTIEHIMPQNNDLPAAWRNEIGPDWERVHKTKLHTLGNLTLTGYNSEYSDNPFAEKRDMPGGFRESPLRLNAGLGTTARWDEEAIDRRAAKLSETATGIWRAPRLPSHVLDRYRPASKPAATASYTIEDHRSLAAGTLTHDLFEQFRKEVLSLDPAVTEEFLKLYIAYKAETNFVDVIPQTSRLLLSINIPFHELNDPRGMARDVTNLGRWGNGDSEVVLDSSEELPYILSLVGQAFERQMGNDSA
ncbi:GmrSD restriction endonuclease domain-containing protein [Sinomonas sp. P47F7]|uniref:GmrSD restriction endonuclease domain-containing protein n=1 Tax=Sinomonas sp. P47F7 TaxID=3410987 RepID=UPI003BF50B7A